jgi:hypothetical protein
MEVVVNITRWCPIVGSLASLAILGGVLHASALGAVATSAGDRRLVTTAPKLVWEPGVPIGVTYCDGAWHVNTDSKSGIEDTHHIMEQTPQPGGGFGLRWTFQLLPSWYAPGAVYDVRFATLGASVNGRSIHNIALPKNVGPLVDYKFHSGWAGYGWVGQGTSKRRLRAGDVVSYLWEVDQYYTDARGNDHERITTSRGVCTVR